MYGRIRVYPRGRDTYGPHTHIHIRRPRTGWRKLLPSTVELDRNDLWIGVYISPMAVYLCPLPCVVLKWRRRRGGS